MRHIKTTNHLTNWCPYRKEKKEKSSTNRNKPKYLQKFLTSPIDLFKVRLHADITIYHSHNVHTFYSILTYMNF